MTDFTFRVHNIVAFEHPLQPETIVVSSGLHRFEMSEWTARELLSCLSATLQGMEMDREQP